MEVCTFFSGRNQEGRQSNAVVVHQVLKELYCKIGNSLFSVCQMEFLPSFFMDILHWISYCDKQRTKNEKLQLGLNDDDDDQLRHTGES